MLRPPTRFRAQLSAFALIGVGNTLVDAATFAALVAAFDWRSGALAVFASSLGFLSGATHSYFWNSRHTFAAAGHGGGLRVVARFGVVVLSGLVVSAATFLAVTLLLGPHARGLAIAKAASIGVVTGWDFLLARS